VNAPSSIERVRRAILTRAYRLTAHAEYEREADSVSVVDIEDAFSSERLEVLEEYPDDPRGPSTLFLSFTQDGRPIHAVIGFGSTENVVFITLYEPNPRLWYDWRRRV